MIRNKKELVPILEALINSFIDNDKSGFILEIID